MRDQGLSYNEIAAGLGIVKSVVAYHARRLGIEADDRFARRYDWAEIQRVYDSGGLSVRECARQFGFTLASWHKAVKRGDVARPRTMAIELLLVPDRPQTNRSHLKHRLLQAGLKENRYEECALTEWQGKPIMMHLHHLNGDGKDNRLENIVFLCVCGNCHSQTDTYGGRNGHRRKRAA